MSTPANNPPHRPSSAPSSEPFYSSFSSAPISSASYSQAPPVGSGEFGVTPEQNPYAGMGYDTLPDPSGHTAAPQGGYTPDPATPDDPIAAQISASQAQGIPDYASGPHSVEDLYRSAGNPYADPSGRAISTAMPATSGAAFAAPPSAPRPAKKRKGVGCLASFLILGLVGLLVLGGIGYLVELWEETEWGESSSLATVADDDLEPGQCFDTLEYAHGNHLQPIPCDEPHRFEVVANHDLGPGPYPGSDELSDTARSTCSEHADRVSEELGSHRISHYALYPSDGGWTQGDHTLTCFISIAGTSRLVGSYADGAASVE